MQRLRDKLKQGIKVRTVPIFGAMIVVIVVLATVTTLSVLLLPVPANAQCLSPDGDDSVRGNLSVESLLNGSVHFGLDLFGELAASTPTGSNVLISPFSVWSALLLSFVGSRGDTESELRRALGLRNASRGDVGRAYKALHFWLALRTAHQKNYSLNIVDAVFLDKNLSVRPCVLHLFDRQMKRTGFSENPEAARSAMNHWVEDQTRRHIRDLFPRGSVDHNTALVLVNAAYFRGSWQSKFDPKETHRAAFHVTPEKIVWADMMHQKGWFYVGRSEHLGCTALELMYAGEEVSMLFLLPGDPSSSAADLAKRLGSHSLQALRRSMWQKEVEITIPKFRLEYAMELSPLLRRVGISALLTPGRCDLSGWSHDGRLAVNSVRHKAFLEVHEEGSEAAAATSILAWRSARPAFTESFNADRPFVLAIIDNLSNGLLFVGVVNKPESIPDTASKSVHTTKSSARVHR